MARKGHTEEEILRVLRGAESGETVVEVCRKHGISQQRGSNCGSITGPISVASGCFPLSNVLTGFAKLLRLRRF